MRLKRVLVLHWIATHFPFQGSVRGTLMALFGLVMLITLLAVSIGVSFFVLQTENAAWTGRQTEAAQNAVTRVTLFIDDTEKLLADMGALDPAELQAHPQLVQQLTQNDPSLLEVVRLDDSGRVIASSFQDEPLLANLFTISQSNWFLQAKLGKPFWGRVQVSSANEPYMIVAFPTPDQGVVAGRVRMKLLWDVVAQLHFGETGDAYVVRRDGSIIAHTNPEIVLANTSIDAQSAFLTALSSQDSSWSGSYTNFMGTPVVGVVVPLPESDWIMITELSQSEAYAMSRTALLTLGGGLFLFSVVIMWVTKKFLQHFIFLPIQQLRDGAEQIGGGKLDYQIMIDRQNEIGQVAHAFNEMARHLSERTWQLQQAKDELERRVVERTSELRDANERLQIELIERQRAQQQLVYSALHDPLTNLPNRTLLMDRLERAIERMKRHAQYQFAVLFLDLDRFKVVNDSLGHTTGDRLLIESARRLLTNARLDDTVARLGGDEFVILVDDVHTAAEIMSMVNRIHEDLSTPYELDGHTIGLSVSIGIVLGGVRYQHAADILRDADIAMYRAKTQGRSRSEIFDVEMGVHAFNRLQVESDLRQALERQEFFLNYQPIVSLATHRITGFEALIRWQHPQRGMVPPDEFIHMAEETGLILPMGQWVLREACRQMLAWQEQFLLEPSLTLNVNLSPKQFEQPNLSQEIHRILQETGLPANCLKLEITESSVMEDAASASVVLSELRAFGVQVQIDDFGTGHSSLAYLQRLPIDTLKIDRSFVNKIDEDESSAEIVRTILTLAHELGMKVVAEGIETGEQLARLQAMRCDFGQGHYFSMPVDKQNAENLISELTLAEPMNLACDSLSIDCRAKSLTITGAAT